MLYTLTTLRTHHSTHSPFSVLTTLRTHHSTHSPLYALTTLRTYNFTYSPLYALTSLHTHHTHHSPNTGPRRTYILLKYHQPREPLLHNADPAPDLRTYPPRLENLHFLQGSNRNYNICIRFSLFTFWKTSIIAWNQFYTYEPTHHGHAL